MKPSETGHRMGHEFIGIVEAVGAVRVPQADGTLFPLPVGRDHALMPSLLTLTDVMATGHHAAVAAKVAPGMFIYFLRKG